VTVFFVRCVQICLLTYLLIKYISAHRRRSLSLKYFTYATAAKQVSQAHKYNSYTAKILHFVKTQCLQNCCVYEAATDTTKLVDK